MLTETDDFFCHQMVAPHARVLHNDPSWAERAYFPVSDPDRFALDVGVSLFPNGDVLEAYAIATVPDGPQWSLRASRDLSAGRWPIAVEPFRFDILDPLTEWRLRVGPNESGIEFDLVYTARAPAFETSSPTIYRRNRLVYENVNLLQTGRYQGWVAIEGARFEVDRIPGHRDRTWGVRASGEGQVPRGLFAWLSAEFDDVALMVIVHERQTGEPVRIDGTVSHEDGDLVDVVAVEHDLEFDFESRQLRRGRFVLTDATERVWEVEVDPAMRLFLSGAGYTAGPNRRGRLGVPLWTEKWDTSDPRVLERVEELNDNICRMRCGERRGHGVVETLLGAHDRYVVRERELLELASF
jgi:hypothetical protein